MPVHVCNTKIEERENKMVEVEDLSEQYGGRDGRVVVQYADAGPRTYDGLKGSKPPHQGQRY